MERRRFDRFVGAGASGESAATGRNEDQIAVRKLRRVKIVVRTVGQLRDLASRQVHLVKVIFPFRFGQIFLNFGITPPVHNILQRLFRRPFRNDF